MNYDSNKSKFENWFNFILQSLTLVLLIAIIVPITYLLLSCSSSKPKEGATPLAISIPNTLGKDQRALAIKAIPKILDTCQGLNKYGNELEYKGISYNPQDEKGISVLFYVPNESRVPLRYRANGHSCEIYVDQAASTLRIQKSECAAVCLDRDIDGTELDPHGADMIIPLR